MIDIGLNISSDRFKSDRIEVLNRAISSGVKGFIFTGTSEKNTRISKEISEEFKDVARFTSGVHPHNSTEWMNSKNKIKEYAMHKNCVAIGECGLDYDRMRSPEEIQKQSLIGHLDLALKLNKPVFLHLRGIDNDINSEKKIIADFKEIYLPYKEKGVKGIVHCFTMGGRSLEALKALDLYIGITGWVCDERRGKVLQSLIKYIPDDRLMVETDAPYLIPKNMIGVNKKDRARNEPAYLNIVVNKIAQLKNKSPEKISEISDKNVFDLFGWIAV